jgi:hypothetical protein
VAGGARHQGAPGGTGGAEGSPDPGRLRTVQAGLLADVREPDAGHQAAYGLGEDRLPPQVTPEEFVHQGIAALDVRPLPVDSPESAPLHHLRIRRFTGDKRTERVGPCRFTPEERIALQEAAESHGYKGESGFIADIALAFLTGRFTVTLPLGEDRRAQHEFRAQVLRELGRIGNNVNQIARALNMGGTPPHALAVLSDLQRLLTDIAEALSRPADPREETRPA